MSEILVDGRIDLRSVGMAWFGSNLLSGTQAYGTSVWGTLVIALAVNCALFVAGLAPAGWLRRVKAV